MLSKKQTKLLQKVEARIPSGDDKYYPRNTLDSISTLPEYLPYTDLYGKTQTIPVCGEDKAFLMRESDMPTFYARTCACGEKMVLMYDSKVGGLPKEIRIEHPCTRRPSNYSKYYSADALKTCNEPETGFKLIWEVPNQNKT